jgi:ATP-binding cassette subfamily B protein
MAEPVREEPRPAGLGGGPRGGMGGGARWLQPVVRAKDRRGTMARLWASFGVERRRIFLVFGLVLLDCAILLAGPWLIGRCVDAMVPGPIAPPIAFAAALGALLLSYGLDAALVVAQGWLMAGASQEIVKSLRKELFGKLQRLPVSLFDSWSHGDLMSRLSNDVDNVSSTIAQSTTQLVSTLLTIAGSFALMLVLSPLLTLAALVTVPLVFLLTRTVSRRTRILFKRQQAALGALNGHIEETISGIDVIKAFGREEAAIGDFDGLSEELRVIGTRAQVWSGYIMPLMNVINNLGFAAVAAVGGVLAVKGLVTIGAIASFISYSRQFSRPLNDLANTYNTLQTALAGAERVFEVMDQAEEAPDRPGAVKISGGAVRISGGDGRTGGIRGIRGEVEFEGVSFGYKSDRPVLRDVSFEAREGSVTALVGPTGAGKTTIVNLLARFYDTGAGSIRIDGRDLRDYVRDDLRRIFGIVLQDSYLFSGSIRENVLYGKPWASEAEMARAVAAANAASFIDRLPRGYDSVLTEGGSPLSEGQRQLLALARAILADPAILILDEATSSVDTRTELHIQAAMIKLMEGRTSFIIAHRLSTIRNADNILVLEGGRIVESGSHDALMAEGGLYHRMYSSQR